MVRRWVVGMGISLVIAQDCPRHPCPGIPPREQKSVKGKGSVEEGVNCSVIYFMAKTRK